jgi:hypothetical protein
VNPVSAYPLQACDDCKQSLISSQGSKSVMSSLRSLSLGSRMIVDFCFRIFWSFEGDASRQATFGASNGDSVRQLSITRTCYQQATTDGLVHKAGPALDIGLFFISSQICLSINYLL